MLELSETLMLQLIIARPRVENKLLYVLYDHKRANHELLILKNSPQIIAGAE